MHYFKLIGSRERWRDLWENRESIDKYITRLGELMAEHGYGDRPDFVSGKKVSFGELIEKAVLDQGIDQQVLCEKTGLSKSVLTELRSDSVYVNNIPILLLLKMVIALNLPFGCISQSIIVSFELLQKK